MTEAQDSDIPLVGQSAAMQTLYRLIARTMNAPAPVLVLGEAGTGKSLIASSLHKFSKRADQPMMVLHPEMMESQSTIRDALMRCGSGTLILDGVSDLSPAAQLRLLHILGEPGDQNLRLVSTAAPNILADVQNGNFRNDLFFRLSSLQLAVPALRERVEDISVLAQHFIAMLQSDIKFELSPAGVAALRDYNWPGNVRQLQNVVGQLMMESPNSLLDGNAVKEVLKKAGPSNAMSALLPSESLAESVGLHVQRYFDLHGANLPPDGVYQRILREIEVPLIEISLAATSGNQAKCADLLGINRNTLRKKISDLEIVVTRRRKMM
jgi:two-component system nitrogen regulation response regulator GlnG